MKQTKRHITSSNPQAGWAKWLRTRGSFAKLTRVIPAMSLFHALSGCTRGHAQRTAPLHHVCMGLCCKDVQPFICATDIAQQPW